MWATRGHVYLETERLVLRRFTSDDVDLVTALDADPAVMRYINGGRPTPRDEIREDYLPAWMTYYETGDRYGFWAAIEKGSGAFVGWFHLRPQEADPDDEPELGYRLIASAWGRPEGLRSPGRPAGVRDDDGGQRRLLEGHGEGRAPLRPFVRPALAGPDRGRGVRRRRIRSHARGMGGGVESPTLRLEVLSAPRFSVSAG